MNKTMLAISGIVLLVLVGGGIYLYTKSADSSTPQAQTPAVAMCGATDLAMTAQDDGATGSIFGTITVRNISQKTCTLEGYPEVTLSLNGGSQAVNQTDHLAGQPIQSGSLSPNETSVVNFLWSNWCGPKVSAANAVLTLPSGGVLNASIDSPTPPRCHPDADNEPTASRDSSLSVTPFQ